MVSLLTTAAQLIDQYGFRFSLNVTSEVYAEMLRIQFKELGLACRVTDIHGPMARARRGFGEWKVTWWQK